MYLHKLKNFNSTQDGPFWGCLWMEEGQKVPLLTSLKYVAHPTIMKLGTIIPYLKILKYMYHVTHPLSSPDINIFSQRISKFRYIKKYRQRLNFDT